MSQHDQEFEELTIGSVAGLQVFLRNAQEQYNYGLTKESELIAEGNFSYGDALQKRFQATRGTVNELISAVQSGGTVSVGDAARLQRQYDDLVAVIEGEIKPVIESASEPEEVSIKPKTGSLAIASEETVMDVKEQVAVSERSIAVQKDPEVKPKKKKKRRRKKKKKPQTDHVAKIEPILAESKRQLASLQTTYQSPNLIQTMLFEEVQESIAQLESLSKMPDLTREQLLSVSEVASHVNRALKAITDAAETEVMSEDVPESVPVVTEYAAETVTPTEPVPEFETTARYEGVSFVPKSVANSTPKSVARPVPKSLKTLPKPADIHEPESLTKKYLGAPEKKAFILEHYSSAAGFERILDATVTKIEADTIDQIDKWLGDLPASAFAFVKDMSTSDFIAFANRPFEAVVADLQKENIKYETFAAWQDHAEEMLEVLPAGKEMKFGQLFAEWMLALAMSDSE